MTKDLYLVITETDQFPMTRAQAEQFLRVRIGFNEPALQHALNGVRDSSDHINLKEGYVIRKAQAYNSLDTLFDAMDAFSGNKAI